MQTKTYFNYLAELNVVLEKVWVFLYVVISYNFLKFYNHSCTIYQALHRMGKKECIFSTLPFKINSNNDHFLFEQPNHTNRNWPKGCILPLSRILPICLQHDNEVQLMIRWKSKMTPVFFLIQASNGIKQIIAWEKTGGWGGCQLNQKRTIKQRGQGYNKSGKQANYSTFFFKLPTSRGL